MRCWLWTSNDCRTASSHTRIFTLERSFKLLLIKSNSLLWSSLLQLMNRSNFLLWTWPTGGKPNEKFGCPRTNVSKSMKKTEGKTIKKHENLVRNLHWIFAFLFALKKTRKHTKTNRFCNIALAFRQRLSMQISPKTGQSKNLWYKRKTKLSTKLAYFFSPLFYLHEIWPLNVNRNESKRNWLGNLCAKNWQLIGEKKKNTHPFVENHCAIDNRIKWEM